MLFAPVASAHPAGLTGALARVQRDGQVEVTVSFDGLAWALNDTPERVPDSAMLALLAGSDSALEQRVVAASGRFRRQFRFLVDGQVIAPTQCTFPSVADIRRVAAEMPGRPLPVLVTCRLATVLPSTARTFAIQFPEVIGAIVLTVERPGVVPVTEPLAAGAVSSTYALNPTEASPSHRFTAFRALLGFVRLGFTHILPNGLDHVLFVLGLFLLGGRLSALLWQVTAFTCAHTLTLGLALYGVIQPRAGLVEPLIAASIVLVAIDNLRSAELRWWRVAVVFAFGLVHGLGFAGALRELALNRVDYGWALLGFNTGVELGQLAVVAMAFLAVGWLRNRADYRRWIIIPGSACIGAIALMWTLERIVA